MEDKEKGSISASFFDEKIEQDPILHNHLDECPQ